MTVELQIINQQHNMRQRRGATATLAAALYGWAGNRQVACLNLFCSQFSPEGWHSKIGESTLADAILDRIVHDSYSIFIDGDDSMRRRKGINK